MTETEVDVEQIYKAYDEINNAGNNTTEVIHDLL